MSEPTPKDSADPAAALPRLWRVLLVDSEMKVMATAGFERRRTFPAEADLADCLIDEGFDLAGIGELLVCLEELPEDGELRLSLGNPGLSIVARSFGVGRGVSCVVLRPSSDAGGEQALPQAWSWALQAILAGRERQGLLPRVLIVDQNAEVVTYGRMLARKLGCRSAGAGCGGEALAQAKARPYDLALVDDRLGGMGAATLAGLLKDRCARDWGAEPLVVFTGAGERPCGSEFFLEKPLGINELREWTQRACADREDRRTRVNAYGQLPVLDMEVWREERVVLQRLALTLVTQSGEFSLRARRERGYAGSRDFSEDLTSLKNGCKILHASRLGAACVQLLEAWADGSDGERKKRLDALLVEIEGFRLFAASEGLTGFGP